MPRYLTNTLVIAYAVGAALTCHIPLAPAASEGTRTPEGNTQRAVSAKPLRSYYLYLPDATISTFQQSAVRDLAWFSWYQNSQTSNLSINGEMEKSASPPTPSLFLSKEAHPTASLMIGWLPAKGGANTPGPYQPDQYQYASTESQAGGCRTVDRTASNAVETPDTANKGLHLPAGWLLGMCLHY